MMRKQINDPSKLKQKLVNYLKYRDRSVTESRRYLRRYCQEEQVIETILDEFQELKLLNDEEFARWLVKSRTSSRKGKGVIFIRQELRKFGIDKSIQNRVLSEYDKSIFIESAQQVLDKKGKKYDSLEDWKRKGKLFQLLARRGFTREVATIAIDSYLSGE